MKNRRSGFTLVEMLVAVGLVSLMMALFAQIFLMATGAMAVQKGIAENDQRSRLAETILRGDLRNRSAVTVQPFETGENAADAADREGYFYIGENDRDDDTDDVLAFTVKVANASDLFFGHAVSLGGSLASTPNQPEFDDGIAVPNFAGSSHKAEVVYFLRAGTLYRRALLIREPIKPAGASSGTPIGGSDGLSGGVMPMTRYLPTGDLNFWTDFDYSASVTLLGPQFHGEQDMSNMAGVSNPFRLGKPNYRFGFNHATGLPREFVGTNFIGRFTHWETSYQPLAPYTTSSPITTFGYPWRIDATAPNPMSEPTLTYDPSTGIVTSYTLFDGNGRALPGVRASEDILLTRVVRFDVKVWDEAASKGPDGVNDNGAIGSDDGDFRDVGHNGANGFYRSGAADPYHQTANGYLGQHPADSARRLWRFDTWNPNVDLEGDGILDPPPFHAPLEGTTRRPLKAIQIRVTFFDPTSQQLRDVTLIQGLTKSDKP